MRRRSPITNNILTQQQLPELLLPLEDLCNIYATTNDKTPSSLFLRAVVAKSLLEIQINKRAELQLCGQVMLSKIILGCKSFSTWAKITLTEFPFIPLCSLIL